MKLRIPPVAAELDAAVEIRGVYVEEWIESLPYANPHALLQSVHGVLWALNRNPVKPSLRSALLEHYLVPYNFLLDLRRSSPAPQGAGAMERHRQEAVALSTLAHELAIGYMRALADGLARNTLFGHGGELATATQRACALLGCALAHTWDGYLTTSIATWDELHTLYLFARSRGTDHQGGAAIGSRDELSVDVDGSYKRALLCALVDPYRLPYGDIWRVFDTLGEQGGRAELGNMRDATRNVGLFAVAPGRLSRPVLALASAGDETVPADALLLDANPLTTELQALLDQLRNSEAGGDDGARITTLGRIIRALGVPPRRHSPRQAESGEVKLVAGLSAIHSHLGGASSGEVPAAAPQEAAVVVEEDGETETLQAPAHHYAPDPWDLSDRGSGGVGISRGLRPHALPAVGELTGVQFTETPACAWTVGVLRWLHMGADDSYRAGVQLLGSAATPALVEVLGNGNALPRPAVLLSTGASNTSRSLLVPGGVFRRDGELRLHADGELLQVRMETLLEASPLFERLSFQASATS